MNIAGSSATCPGLEQVGPLQLARGIPLASDETQGRLAEIFVRKRSEFLRFVRGKLSELSASDAEDVLSDVAYNLLSRADVVAQVENLSAYVYRSLANRVVDFRRAGVSTLSIDAEDQSGAAVLELVDEHPDPERSAELGQLRRHLHAALGELTPRERAVWIATEIDGRSFRELADEWDEPIGTLLSLKSRATARLRALLSEYRGTRNPKEPT